VSAKSVFFKFRFGEGGCSPADPPTPLVCANVEKTSQGASTLQHVGLHRNISRGVPGFSTQVLLGSSCKSTKLNRHVAESNKLGHTAFLCLHDLKFLQWYKWDMRCAGMLLRSLVVDLCCISSQKSKDLLFMPSDHC
jgi:hypothetical protein